MARQDEPNWSHLATIGLEVAVGVGLGLVVGIWIDGKFHTDPWGTMIGAGVGLAAGLYLLIKEGFAANKD